MHGRAVTLLGIFPTRAIDMKEIVQAGILADIPPLARHLVFQIDDASAVAPCLRELAAMVDGDNLVIGVGQSLVLALGCHIDGLSVFPAQSANGIDIPSTPAALWCYLRGDDRGELFHNSRIVENLLKPAFILDGCIDSFQFNHNQDLSGYEDGTENPQGDDALHAAIVQGRGPGLDGSSFVAVQQWLHDFERFDAMDGQQQDDIIGRHAADNEEFDEAPESAHVKRTAQEGFEPEAFMLRRSMPWADGMRGGLVFVAFGHSFDAFATVMQHMIGQDDGVSDGLFGFTRPLTGAYFWCPAMRDGDLDLSPLGM